MWTSVSLAFATAPGEQTSEAETIRLEVDGERSDGRDSCWQAGPSFVAESSS